MALLRLSDALKCSDLGTTKVQQKSCVTAQIITLTNITKIYNK
nr:MAG TPA: hypothetical protein [Caudoviricetes sp.]